MRFRLVDRAERPTEADYALESPVEVRRFLERLADRLMSEETEASLVVGPSR